MAVFLSPVGGAAVQFFDNSGQVLTGGLLYTYLAGTTTPAATYTSNTGTQFHTNPIILDASGRIPNGGEVWLAQNIQYKFVLKDANSVLIGTWDNIIGINSNFLNYSVQEETQTATQGQTVFTLATISYTPGTNTLSVYVNGSKQIPVLNYAETDATTVTFLTGLNVGDVVDFTTAVSLSSGVTSADLVTYNEGGTGAITRTVQAKLQESVSIKDFGAVGDGVTDDTDAIQNTFNYAIPNNIQIVIPSGTYLINGSITITKASGLRTPTYITGGGTLYKPTTGTMFTCANPATSEISFTNIFFLGDLTANVVAFYCGENFINSYFINCSFRNFTTCFNSTGYLMQSLYFTNCIFTSIASYAFNVISANNVKIDKCTCEEMSTGSFWNGPASSLIIRDGLFENFAGAPVIQMSGAGSVDITGNYFEANAYGDIVFSNTSSLTGVTVSNNIANISSGLAFIVWGKTLLGCISMNNTVNGAATNNATAATTGVLATFQNYNVGGAVDTGPCQEVALQTSNTITPVVEGTTTAGTCTYSAQSGNYTQIGNVVYFTLNVAWSGHTGTGSLIISGLPAQPINQYFACSALTTAMTATAGYLISAGVIDGLSHVFVLQQPVGTSASSYVTVPITTYTSGGLIISGSYIAR